MFLFTPQSYQAAFPSGTRVRLVAVMDVAHRAWTPEGKTMKPGQLPPAALGFRPKAAPNTRFFVAQVTTRKAPSVAFQLVGGAPHGADFMDTKIKGTWVAIGAANHGANLADVRIGVADKAWQTVGSVEPSSSGGLRRTGLGFLRMVRPNPIGRTQTIVADVVLPVDPYSQAYRVVAFDKGGKALPLIPSGMPVAGAPAQIFFTGAYESVKRVELQVRPYVWKTFKNVHL